MKLKKLMLLSLALASVVAVSSCGKTSDDTSSSAVNSASSVENSDNNGTQNTGAKGDDQNENVPSDEKKEEDDTVVSSTDKMKVETGSGQKLTDGQVQVTECLGETESAYIEYKTVSGADSYNIYLKGAGDADYKLLGNNDRYTRAISTGMRTDLFGLKAGNYNIKIAPVANGSEISGTNTVYTVGVVAYDRSGYAHFNYANGVGAYNDDGTLKENAIVLYVTDENKNTVTLSYGGKTVTGIGNILNTAGQKCTDAGHENDCKKVSSGKTYYGTGNDNQGILKDLATAGIPLVIRFVGCVSDSGLYQQGTFAANSTSKINGLTEYDSVNYGGSEGDNGHMARMKSGKDITLEGVGDDATIDGWGFHFMCESSSPELGKSFEVRNLCFMNNPEDAIGMEGVQESSKITASVERCWVHNNTFLKPSISGPAESDKADGDGSCDFKRGQYFTMDYNYFEYCHKTNLIGSSDSSLQYNITFHHNIWYNCGSRIPLLRQANIHFYNNYVYGDSNDDDAALSYVSSLRANCYMYSEYNFYEGCKAVAEDTGGKCKQYNNAMVQCFNGNTGTEVSSRTESVPSSCAYDGVSYSDFDTNASVFYYDATNKRSDCYLTSAGDARTQCILEAGSKYRTKLNLTTLKTTRTAFNDVDPEKAVDISAEVTLPTSKSDGTYSNMVWSGIQGYSSSTGVKARGKFCTFKVDVYTTITIAGSGGSSQALAPLSLVASDGTVVLSAPGSAVLAPGVYTICSCQKDKDTYVTAISFAAYDSSAFKTQLINEYNEAYAAIPTEITYDEDCYQKIKEAVTANAALGDDKSEVSTTPYTALDTFVAKGVVNVEALINAIGTVTKDSGSAITSARTAYDALINYSSKAAISNLDTLTAAEVAYSSFAKDAFAEAVNAIGTVTLDSKADIDKAQALYDALDDEQKTAVSASYQTLKDAESDYAELKAADDVDTLILNANDLASYKAAIDAYDALTTAEKALVTGDISAVRVAYAVAAINDIGTVDNTSGTKISTARAAYDALTAAEKENIESATLTILTDAEEYYSTLVIEYTKSWSYASEGGTTTSGTTADGFEYSSAKSLDSSGGVRIKGGNNNYLKLSNIGSTAATVKITSKLADTSSPLECNVLVTYTDGSTETKTFTAVGSKDTATEVTIEISGTKTISSISVTGPSSSKNLVVSAITIIYTK